MDNELICNKFINQYLLRGRKFVEYACFRYGYYNKWQNWKWIC